MRSIECEGISSLRKIEQGMVIEEAFINADPREQIMIHEKILISKKRYVRYGTDNVRIIEQFNLKDKWVDRRAK